MSMARTRSVALVGVTGIPVEIEADVSAGLPAFAIVGLPDSGTLQARERVRSASGNCGALLPSRRITVNLSPASLPKSGTALDLGIAVAVLAAIGSIPADAALAAVHLGELGLDGAVKPVPGILPSVLAARDAGADAVFVPAASLAEAQLVGGIRAIGVTHLRELIEHHNGRLDLTRRVALPAAARTEAPTYADMSDVIGQNAAVEAATVAAAGGHHLLMTGPPGAGKTMIAARLPGLLPQLTPEQALEVTAVHSAAGALADPSRLVRLPPLQAPHHTATVAAMAGGGSSAPRPGAISLAHCGILFLDEAPEFSVRVLEALRQPLESGDIVIHRARHTVRFPARFQLVLAANPCPCGKGGGDGRDCTCTVPERRRYAGRLSGPILDRIDMRVELSPVRHRKGTGTACTAQLAARVSAARGAAAERLGAPGRLNAHLGEHDLAGRLRPPRDALRDLDLALERGRITMRGYARTVRIAWTLADLDGAACPTGEHVGRALLLRAGTGASA